MTDTISCAVCRDSLIDFVAERLPLAERAAVEGHLAGCDACRRELASWHALKAAFADVGQDVPPDTGSAAGWQRVRAALEPQSAAAALTLDQHVEAHAPQARSARAVRSFRLAGARRSALPAVAAVLLVSVLAAALFHTLGAGQSGAQGHRVATATAPVQLTTTPVAVPTATASPGPSACPAGSGVRANLPNASYLGDLSMISATEGWASGSIVDPTTGFNNGTLLLHFSHCRWDQAATSIPDAALGSIDMLAAGEGWAVGGTMSGPEHGVALHYANGAWQQVTLPYQSSSEGIYTVVRMLSATEGWIIFESVKSASSAYTYYALHYRNGVWTRVDLSYAQIGDMAAVGPDELWLAATAGNGDATIVHYKSGTQTTYPLPGSDQLGAFHVVSPNDIWLTGWNPSYGYDSAETRHVFVTHWDGANWNATSVGQDPAIQNVKGLAVFGPSDGWAFPAPVSSSQITPIASTMRLGADGWTAGSWPFNDLIGVQQVRAVGPDEYWAIGTYMQTHDYPDGSQSSIGRTVLLHFAGGTWSMYGHG